MLTNGIELRGSWLCVRRAVDVAKRAIANTGTEGGSTPFLKSRMPNTDYCWTTPQAMPSPGRIRSEAVASRARASPRRRKPHGGSKY